MIIIVIFLTNIRMPQYNKIITNARCTTSNAFLSLRLIAMFTIGISNTMCQLSIAVSGPRRENRYVVVGALLLSSVVVYISRHVCGDYIRNSQVHRTPTHDPYVCLRR